MASLYANENFPEQAVEALRALGHDVLTTADAGQAHAGIIVCTQDADPVGQAQRIHETIAAAGPLSGQLLRVNRPPR